MNKGHWLANFTTIPSASRHGSQLIHVSWYNIVCMPTFHSGFWAASLQISEKNKMLTSFQKMAQIHLCYEPTLTIAVLADVRLLMLFNGDPWAVRHLGSTLMLLQNWVCSHPVALVCQLEEVEGGGCLGLFGDEKLLCSRLDSSLISLIGIERS